jgi:hypothetical protein
MFVVSMVVDDWERDFLLWQAPISGNAEPNEVMKLDLHRGWFCPRPRQYWCPPSQSRCLSTTPWRPVHQAYFLRVNLWTRLAFSIGFDHEGDRIISTVTRFYCSTKTIEMQCHQRAMHHIDSHRTGKAEGLADPIHPRFCWTTVRCRLQPRWNKRGVT